MTKPMPWSIGIVCGAIVIFIGGAVLFGIPQWRYAAALGRHARARAQLEALASAGQSYFLTHRELPVRLTVELLTSLSPVPYIPGAWSAAEMTRTNHEGEIVDPWGTPIRFSLDQLNRVQARSAGPNRVPNDDDDLAVSAMPPDTRAPSRADEP